MTKKLKHIYSALFSRYFQKSSSTATLSGKLNFLNVLPLELQSKERRHLLSFLWRHLLSLPFLAVQSSQILSWTLFHILPGGYHPPSSPSGIHHPISGLIRSVPGTVLAAGDVAVNKTDTLCALLELVFYCGGERQ